jgi:hypothetical protein
MRLKVRAILLWVVMYLAWQYYGWPGFWCAAAGAMFGALWSIELGSRLTKAMNDVVKIVSDKTAEVRAMSAMIVDYQKSLEEFAEYDCEYGDECPRFGTRHGVCIGCKARRSIEWCKRKR